MRRSIRRMTPGAANSRCARCGTPFRCAKNDAGGCWCAQMPALPPAAYPADAACLCETCLRRALADAASVDTVNAAREAGR
jgi:hypothetical protein